MTNLASRESYIESEYKKWEERFEIPFQQEFNVKALLSLQHQFLSLPEDHTKAKADVIKTINDLQRNLDLKPKRKLSDNEKRKIMFVVDSSHQLSMFNAFLDAIIPRENKEQFLSTTGLTKIYTDTYEIKVVKNSSLNLRGQRADVVFNVKDGSKLLS